MRPDREPPADEHADDTSGGPLPNRLTALPLFAPVTAPASAPVTAPVAVAVTPAGLAAVPPAPRALDDSDGGPVRRLVAQPQQSALPSTLPHGLAATADDWTRAVAGGAAPLALRPAAPTDLPGGPHGMPVGERGAAGAASPTSAGTAVDWAQVRAFRQSAAELLTAQLRDRTGLDEAARREIGRSLIVAMLRDHADSLLAEGLPPPTPAQEHALAGAVFDALFGLGRLQPLVDNPDVENIEITGCDQVYLVFGDGRVEQAPAVADSDEELIEALAFLAARSGGSERAFTSANPILDLTLHGGARLAARAWITPRPLVVIRRHRLTDVDLTDLTRLGMVDEVLARFLAAAVVANKTIVVSGAQGAGKTTLIRALCNEMDPWERIGTIESEYELHLHELPDRHRRIAAHQARPGTGERSPDGRAAGEVTMDDLLFAALRENLSRVIVGEVRGREVIPMFKAMQAGAGSLSTTHAHHAEAAIERLVTCALEAGPHVTQDYAYLQIALHIDLIVHIAVDDQTRHGGRKLRHVSQVIEVQRGGEGSRPAVTQLFVPGPDGRAVPRTRPSFLTDLQQVGFDPRWLDQRDGTWTSSGRPQ